MDAEKADQLLDRAHLAMQAAKRQGRMKEIMHRTVAMPKLLIIDEIGKNISGTGMDTNVISYRGIKGRTSDGPLDFPVVNQQATQMDEVAECILAGKPMRVPGEEGLKDMIVVDQIYAQVGRK